MIGHARTQHRHTTNILLHDGNGFSHSLHLGSNRTGKRKQSPHLYAAHRCGRKRSSRPSYRLLLNFQLRLRTSPPSSASCRSAAVNQICQVSQLVRQSHHDSCRPRGPQKEKIGSELELSLITAVDGTPRCHPTSHRTGRRPSLCRPTQ